MIFDLHNDLITSELSEIEKLDYLRKNIDETIVLAYWTSKTKKPLSKIEQSIKNYNAYNVLFSVEDIWFLNDNNIDSFVKLPILYCTLAWNSFNGIAGGHSSSEGISPLGHRLIQKFVDSGIKVDTAHLNEKSFYQVCEKCEKVFNSHTCQKSIYVHSRNISNEQIKAIIEKNGVVGLTFVDAFLGKVTGFDGIVRQIDTFTQTFGTKNLAIGTDFFGTEPILGLETYKKIKKLATKLEKMGYNKEAIEDIFFNNANNFFYGTIK